MLAARNGHAYAQAEFGVRLADGLGIGIARDCVQMLHWFRQSARQFCTNGLDHLAQACERGYGVRKDLVAAQVLRVLAARRAEVGGDIFHTAADADPRTVRRLIAEIDGGADLLEVLQRHGDSSPPKASAGGLSLASVQAPRRADQTPAVSATGRRFDDAPLDLGIDVTEPEPR